MPILEEGEGDCPHFLRDITTLEGEQQRYRCVCGALIQSAPIEEIPVLYRPDGPDTSVEHSLPWYPGTGNVH